MNNRIALTINGREVYWEITAEQSALLAQTLVQYLGPADGETGEVQ
ncbi:hypothetical protein SEA_RASOVI_58 [Microbacterium phage Rasovi]|nr:hypothetical protein SEA_RASOVI_58 [Microbacterium phage Rasovi]